jgi:hypothetical protein
VVRIDKGAPASRTALPTLQSPEKYTIAVTRDNVSLAEPKKVDAGEASYVLSLSSPPQAGDVVTAEGFDSEDQLLSSGNYTLPHDYDGEPVTIDLRPRAGSELEGDVDLEISFSPGVETDKIVTVDLKLYRNPADFLAEKPYRLERYSVDDDLDSPLEDSSKKIIPIANNESFPSGNYVVEVDFFRAGYVRVSRLVQTIIVWGGLTTNTWVESESDGKTLEWDTNYFADSCADLEVVEGIKIDGTVRPG